MRVTSKGQVTIPQHIREKLGIAPYSEVDFVEDDNGVYIVKKDIPQRPENIFDKLKGTATVRMSTDAIMALTREE